MYKLQIGSGFSSQLLTGCILIDFFFFNDHATCFKFHSDLTDQLVFTIFGRN